MTDANSERTRSDFRRGEVARAYTGSCLCGVVSFAAREFDGRAAHCHCRMCRKFHGAAYATIVGVPRRSFEWRSGRDALVEYRAANGTVRSFCKHCGSSLFFWSPNADPETVEVALGAFDQDVPVVPDAHIFVGSAANWTVIADELPQFVEGRDIDTSGS